MGNSDFYSCRFCRRNDSKSFLYKGDEQKVQKGSAVVISSIIFSAMHFGNSGISIAVVHFVYGHKVGVTNKAIG
jgi:hypothetical protein